MAIAIASLTPLFLCMPLRRGRTALSWRVCRGPWSHGSRFDRPWRVLMLALLLGSATALHYYAVLGVVPFVLAEISQTWWTRRVRARIWLAFLTPAVPLAISWPLLQALRSGLVHTSGPRGALNYPQCLRPNHGPAVGVGNSIAMAVSIGLLSCIGPGAPSPNRDSEFSEVVLLLGFSRVSLRPRTLWRWLEGRLTPRYVLPATLGLMSAIAISAGRHSWRLGTRCLGVLVLIGWAQGTRLLGRPRATSPRYDECRCRRSSEMAAPAGFRGSPARRVKRACLRRDVYYEEKRSSGQRFTYLVIPKLAVKYASSDTIEATVQRLAGIMRLRRAADSVSAATFAVFDVLETWPLGLAVPRNSWTRVTVLASCLRSDPGGSRILLPVEHTSVAPLPGP